MTSDMRDLLTDAGVQGVGDGYTSLAPVSIPQTTPIYPKSLDDLQAECDAMRGYDPGWYVKMMHRIPPTTVVDRVAYILDRCRGKRVLHLGCGWPPGLLQQALEQITTAVVGVDICVPEGPALVLPGGIYACVDLDTHPDGLPDLERYEMIVAAEILEHLANPGRLLAELWMHKTSTGTLLITVPNAFSKVGYHHITAGIEQVNAQHVAWYSWHTLKELVTRYGYAIEDFCWYNCPSGAQPQESEGLIMVVR